MYSCVRVFISLIKRRKKERKKERKKMVFGIFKGLFSTAPPETISSIIKDISKNPGNPTNVGNNFQNLYKKLNTDSSIEEAANCRPIPDILNAMDKCPTSSVVSEYGCKILIVFKNHDPDYTRESIVRSKLLRVLERIQRLGGDASNNAKALVALVRGEEKKKEEEIEVEKVVTKDTASEDVEMKVAKKEEVVIKIHEAPKNTETSKSPKTIGKRDFHSPKVTKVKFENYNEPEKKRPRPMQPCDEIIGSLFNGLLSDMGVGYPPEKLEECKAHVRYCNSGEIMDDDTALAMCWYTLIGSFGVVQRAGPRSKDLVSMVARGFNNEKMVKKSHDGPFYFVVRQGEPFGDKPVPVTSSLEYAKETLDRIKRDGEMYSIVILESAFGCDMTEWSFEEKEAKKGVKKLIVNGSEIMIQTDTEVVLDGCTNLVKAECKRIVKRNSGF